MKSSIYKILAGLFGIFGLCACDSRVAYGTPYGEYQIRGTVTDTEGNAIPGIVVSVGKYGEVKTTTNAKGYYEINLDYSYGDLYFTDEDGEDNGGQFEAGVMRLNYQDFEQIAPGDDKSWYSGRFLADHKDKEMTRETLPGPED